MKSNAVLQNTMGQGLFILQKIAGQGKITSDPARSLHCTIAWKAISSITQRDSCMEYSPELQSWELLSDYF